MIDLYNALRHHTGAKWIRADCHVHTPASHDFRWSGLNRQDFDAYRYLTAMQQTGLQLVAITDHSTGAWIDPMRQAAKDLKRHGRLVILPGVEVSVSGIHFLLIFPETHDQAHVDHVLSQLAIPPKDRGKRDTICTKSVLEVIEICHQNNGMIIGAHCLSGRSGMLSALSGVTRREALERIDALEVKSGSDANRVAKRVEELGRKDIPILVSTDAHHPDELSSNVSYLKMGKASFRGLSQIRYEPLDRVGTTQPVEPSHPRIIGFRVSQGLYGDVPVRFSPHLNTLIGGRGSGKSAILDLLRFALGITPRIKTNEPYFNDRIKNFIGVGGTIQVYFQDEGAHVYCAERRGDYTENRRGGQTEITFECRPKLLQLVDDRFIELTAKPLERIPVEFFAQGEVMELARKAEDQLALLDEHVAFGGLKESEQRLIADLEENQSAILEVERAIEELSQQAAEWEALQQRVSYLRDELSNPVFQVRSKWDQERAFMSRAGEHIDSFTRLAHRPVPILQPLPPLDESTPSKLITGEVRSILTDLVTDFESIFVSFRASVENANSRFQEVTNRWKPLDDAAEEEFRQALREVGGLELQALHRELAKKKDQLQRIEEEIRPALDEKNASLKTLVAARSSLVSNLLCCRKEIHQTRATQLAAIQNRLESVRVAVRPNVDRRDFSHHMHSMYKGAGIHGMDAQIERVVERLAPHELADLLLQQDASGLISATNITPATASKLIGFPKREDVLNLQTVPLSDEPEISLKRIGEERFTQIGQLSVGERCSAILSIALLEKNRPLLIDQPEDELDYQFVIDDIVANIKAAKASRQLIVATHNPNIPVLGDAELVLRVSKDPGVNHCRILAEGALEDDRILPEVIGLDGGKDAFERRRRKYMIA